MTNDLLKKAETLMEARKQATHGKIRVIVSHHTYGLNNILL